jgi:DNA-binding protein H-NS
MASAQIARIRKQIEKLVRQEEEIRKAAVQGVVAQIRKMMEEHGISVSDLRGAKRGKPGRKPGRPAKAAGRKARAAKPAAKTRRAKVKPKYRSPEDKKVTWTGRGRTPVWARNWVESGKKLDDLLIK